MNVLFYYDNYCGNSSHGGTEVATFRIANAIKVSGNCRVFNAYLNNHPGKDDGLFDAVTLLQKKESRFVSDLSDFINKWEIDVIVNMGCFFRHKRLIKAISQSGRNCKIIFMHHFAPGSENRKVSYSAALHLLQLYRYHPIYWLRLFFYPLMKSPRKLSLPRAYRAVYKNSDAVVLLSSNYIEDFRKFAGIAETDKFHAIPNIYDAPEAVDVVPKEKRVVMLSRLAEVQKRLSLALRIWKKIEDRGDLNDWHLDIVGTGRDEKALMRLAKSLKLKNITFHGWKNGADFLKKSSILMMTSEYEGLSLSMIEAQTFGCVPVAFNSYSSLSDIVEDEVTGLAISPHGDIDIFAKRLADLMLENKPLSEMAIKSRENSSRFSSDTIASRWLSLLSKLRIS